MTLPEIKTAIDTLSPEERGALLRSLLRRRSTDPPPAAPPVPREFSREQIQEWIDQDEADLYRFNAAE